MGEASFGKYRLIAELGNGGMADVFLAVLAGPAGSGFRKLSVIKRLRQNLVDDPEFVAMLIEEARIAARLNHSNVVQTNEVGQVGEQYFIAMEYLDGQPLHRVQHRSAQRTKTTGQPAITNEQQMVILMDTLAGLHHAHELANYDGTPLDIVHRDVTPQNIFVTYEGQVKVVDFGIAKAAGRASETRAGVVKGKIRYMAPEQATMGTVDRRADVFSVGVMLWEVAAGRRMWPNMDDMQIAHHLIGETFPTSPREVNPNVSEALDRICRKALAAKRDERYESAEAFRADLEEYLADTGHLVAARRKLASAVSDLFADKRAAIKGVIETQLAALEVLASGEFQALPLAPESILSSSSSGISAVIAPPSSPPSSHISGTSQSFARTLVSSDGRRPSRQPPPRVEPPQRSGDGVRRVAAGIVVVVAMACVAFVIARRTMARPPVAAIQAAPVDEDISLRLDATPESARVVIDDEPPRSVPLDIRVKKDDGEHRVRIEADGYVPRTETVRFVANLALSIDLQAVPVTRAKTEPAKPTRAAVAAPVFRSAPTPAVAVAAPEPVAAPTPTPAPPPGEMQAKPQRPKAVIDNGDPWAKR
jgi:eukaryotic-like serine/threonine-protein kinase